MNRVLNPSPQISMALPTSVSFNLGMVWTSICVALLASVLCLSLATGASGMQTGGASTADEGGESKVDVEAKPVDLPDAPEDGILPVGRAWEYQHYRVRVWITSDGSPEINGLVPRLSRELEQRAEMADASSWEVLAGPAPNPWNWRFDRDLSKPDGVKGFENERQLAFDDKLIVVSLQRSLSGIHCRVREFDLPAQQWGSLLEREIGDFRNIGSNVFQMLMTAFMPVAQIDSSNERNEVEMRARAVLSCLRLRMTDTGEWTTEPNPGSPVFIKPTDVFLPVLRRTDRDNKLISLDPVAYTFVTVDNIDGARINGHVQSTVRAPLAARKSKRLQKIALVIRPPVGNTTLGIVSSDESRQPMEGIEVFSRRPNADKDEESELLGKTDWRGYITIPPSPDGMRMIYLKRGNRAMRKLPIVPGFIKFQVADITNDEARLFAEGVIEGVKIELLDLVTQRAVYEDDIAKALNKDDFTRARDFLSKYRELPRPQQFSMRLSEEKSRLLSRARDDREIEFIAKMFDTLTSILSDKVGDSKETIILQRIQEAAGITGPKRDDVNTDLTPSDGSGEEAAPESNTPAKTETGDSSGTGDAAQAPPQGE